MADTFVLCRRDLADFGEPTRYCAKPITTKNPFNYCPDCAARFPLWPVLTREEAQEVMRDLMVGMPDDGVGGFCIKRDLLRPHELIAYDCARAALGGR